MPTRCAGSRESRWSTWPTATVVAAPPGLYNLLEPEISGELRADKTDAIVASGARTVASANPGLRDAARRGTTRPRIDIYVVHPIQLLDRAYADQRMASD